MTIDFLPIDLIDPSPFQHRRHFDDAKLEELSRSIQRDGLIEPIVVRDVGERYELIAGERRLRATRMAGRDTIMARLVHVTDARARRMCAAENLQREDLSAVEQVEATVDMIDAELVENGEYAAAAITPVDRVKWLLGRLDAVATSQRRGSEISAPAEALFHRFMEQVERIFNALPRPVDWRSFYNNDLKLVTELDPEVREWAIKKKLNKSQAKALDKLKDVAPAKFQEIVENDGAVQASDLLDFSSDEAVAIEDISAREMTRIANRERGLAQFEQNVLNRPKTLFPTPPSMTLGTADAAHLPLPDASVDLVVTSPPYGVGVEYEATIDDAESWYYLLGMWLAEMYRVTKHGGRLALNIPLDTSEGGRRPTWPQACKAAIDAGWTFETTIIWNEDNISNPLARGSVASPSAPKIIARVEVVGIFCKGQWDREAWESWKVPDLTMDEWLDWTNGLWTFPGESRAWEGHPAPFPAELPRRLIKLLSFPGDVILDPFVGSGTTAIVAARLGRQVYGYDISEAYIESARRRVAAQERSAA